MAPADLPPSLRDPAYLAGLKRRLRDVNAAARHTGELLPQALLDLLPELDAVGGPCGFLLAEPPYDGSARRRRYWRKVVEA